MLKNRLAALFGVILLAVGCGGGGGSSSTAYTVGGTVAGLAGTVVLQNNSEDDLTVSASGAFTFATSLADGAEYLVTVKTQPEGQTCTASSNSGTISGNVTDITVVCSSTTYTIGGTVSGLSGTVVLQNNGADDLSISANGNFTFATAVAEGAEYEVTVKTQPTGKTCTASHNSGTASADVTSVTVVCSADSYTVGGAVTGLAGTVVLQNNSDDDLTVTEDGDFTFATAVADGSEYDVTVKTQPAGQTCTVTGGSGTISGNVTNVGVACVTNDYTVGGSVSGLTGTVVLQNNSADDLTITEDGDFTFGAALAYGTEYEVTVKTQPTGQTCTASNNSGTISGNVTNVSVTCSTNDYTVGGSVSGLSGTVVLQNNSADDLTITEDGDFTFATSVAYGAGYDVTVETQPAGQTCTVSSGSGTMPASNVTDVEVSCANAAWARSTTVGASNSKFFGASRDTNGNIYAVGYIYGTGNYDFGNDVVAAGKYADGANAVIVKYNTLGVAQWAKTVTAASDSSQFSGVSVGASGNIYVVGAVMGTGEYDFGGATTIHGTASSLNALVGVYSSSGAFLGGESVTAGSDSSYFNGITVDDDETYVYAVGYITGTGDYNFGDGVINGAYAGGANVVIVKYSVSGEAQWSKTVVSGSGSSSLNSVAINSAGVIGAVGYINGNDEFVFGNLVGFDVTATGAYDGNNVLLLTYDTDGQIYQAGTTAAASNNSYYNGIGADSNNDFYAVGYTNGTACFNVGGGCATGKFAGQNALIVKYDDSAAPLFTKTVTVGSSDSSFNGVSLDDNGNPYAVGYITGTGNFDFGSGVVNGAYATGPNSIVVKYNTAGTNQWAKPEAEGSNDSHFQGVTVDADGNIFAVGDITGNGTFNFDSNDVSGTYADGLNALIVKYLSE